MSHLRRSTALATGTLLLAAPLLTACGGFGDRLDATRGFQPATGKVNTLSNGTNDRTGVVDILGAVVIAGEPDRGLFTATLVNGNSDESEFLESLAGGGSGDLTFPAIPQPEEIARRGVLSLYRTGGVPVTGDFNIGDFVTVTLGFSGDQVTSFEVPVVPPCFAYSPEKLGVELPAPAEGATPYDCDIDNLEGPAHGGEEGE
ncbi:hypothetical protein [Nocardioides sp.]|uniref:hypothetical protein n=1 Tax=Nocardioides sp. TaxID=35761 RepID=UPI003516A41B